MDPRAALSGGLSILLALLLAQLDEQEPEASTVDERPIHERIDLPSIAACGGCHLETWREWSESLHGKAWTNANVRNATNDFRKKSCRPCHSPLPVLPTGLDVRPSYRDFNQDDGVHCLSCHGLEDGVAAARTLPDAPCKPRYEPRLLRADMCYPCHEPTHGAFTEYERSDAKALGVRCVDCHMQPRKHAPGRSHGPHGGMNADFVARAMRFEAELQADTLKVHLTNRTGHKFPGEIPSRSLLVRVSYEGSERKEFLLLRKPHKRENRVDNRLEPDEVRTLTFNVPTEATRAKVRVLFKPLPLLEEKDAFTLVDWSQDVVR